MSEKRYPEATIGALIFHPDGKLFLMRSHKWQDTYVIPGGHIEFGETMKNAVRREVKEETNLDVYDIQFNMLQDVINPELFWKRDKHYIFFDFVCRTDSTDVILNHEAQSYDWFAPKEALKLPLNPYTRTTIETYLKKIKN